MSKKNLDKLFQEKLSDFSDVPTEKVWRTIEVSLNKKKKSRKVIPFWWKLGGIAAVLALGLFLINPFKDSDADPNAVITDVEQLKEDNQKKSKDSDQSPIPNAPEVVGQTFPEAVKTQNTNRSERKTKPLNTPSTIATSSKNQEKEANGKSQGAFGTQQHEVSEIAARDSYKTGEMNDTNNSIGKETEAVRVAGGQVAANAGTGNDQTADAHTDENRPIRRDSNAKEEAIIALKSEEVEENSASGTLSIFDAMDKEEEGITEVKESKWSAGPSIAPVYFNAFGNGSPVHSIFVPNSKSGDVNLSYGLAISYEINKKLSIKTGIHKVDYGYNTNDVAFTSTLERIGNGQIENINYSSASRNILVDSKSDNFNSLTNRTALDVATQNPSLSGVMAQQFGYLEIPLELKYALVDRTFGVDLIGGLSSLILVDNSVSLTSGELTTEMGEANNVNTMNFSTNIGFGVNYKFTPKVQLNIAPMFKYQLNTFSGTAGDFQPFTIGVYSGLNFKF
ncbi:MAG: outer membrane beta-barrel protein [Maribacter sp.]|uniref:outer membrane beta-barrel protein n=1 Tax=Maribacter sp. TaxID=1897614 RepID=UPI003C72844B